MDEEVAIVTRRVAEMVAGLDLPVPKNAREEIARVLTTFRELRSGATEDGRTTLKTPSGSLSTATLVGGLSQMAWFNDGRLGAPELAANVVGAIAKDPAQDKAVLEEYLETVLKKRRDYSTWYAALNEAL
ncbi:MAG: hypothetical protein LBE85_01650 [Candidatus Accumulibacter sp.]|jgi:hypothetical protein|nr:hypothetical protein [Accumulibacter sp.]